MARLLALVVLALFATSNAGLLPTSEQHQPVTRLNQVHATESWSWQDCGSPDEPIQIDSIAMSPDPPKLGQNLTVTVRAHTQDRVEDGAYADIDVKVGLINLLHKEFDLCEEGRNVNTSFQCPVEKGDFEVVHTVALLEIPRVKYNIKVQGYTNDDDDLFCVDLSVDFRG